MADQTRELPPPSDPLGETLHLLQLHGTLYCRSELTAPWGIDLPPFEDCMMFHVITSGHCVLEVDGAEPIRLERGSLALVPHGRGHRVRSDARADALPLFDIPVERVSERYEIMRHGGGGERTELVCGVARFDHVAAEHLIAQLPEVLHVDSWSQDEGGWLRSTLQFIAAEARALKPGGETVITRLADVLVIQVLRAWIDGAPSASHGWLAALRDERLGRALVAMHREPERDWGVESLAEFASMSRSAFAARFAELVGVAPMRYLTSWRLRLARRRLRDGDDPLVALADGLGYRSEAAFCRAFKREFGESPGSVRRRERAESR
ncbi:MAG: AraC family transcriptional regulator [Planctomycetes bacterium]|nr:AraC family transcriptional regulator [Planctomycetota bacterium]